MDCGAIAGKTIGAREKETERQREKIVEEM
jgi:hypothetical protein